MELGEQFVMTASLTFPPQLSAINSVLGMLCLFVTAEAQRYGSNGLFLRNQTIHGEVMTSYRSFKMAAIKSETYFRVQVS